MLLAAAHPLVHVNAALNVTATVLLLVGLALIKQRRVTAHKRTMLTAFVVSIAFLSCYSWYHFVLGIHVDFTHPGNVKYVYYAVLASHIPLAFSVPVLAIWTIYLGHRATAGEGTVPAAYRAKHRRLARWTFPIWLYVSVTGVMIYVMLYHLWPPVE